MINENLLLAVENGRTHLVELLAKTAETTDKNLALLQAVQHNQLDAAAILLENGADIDTRGPQHATLPILAVRLKNRPMLELLLRNGADIYAKDGKGHDVFHYAETLHKASSNGSAEAINYGLLLGKMHYDKLIMDDMDKEEFDDLLADTQYLSLYIKYGMYKHMLYLAGGSIQDELTLLEKSIDRAEKYGPMTLLTRYMLTLYGEYMDTYDHEIIKLVQNKINTIQASLTYPQLSPGQHRSYFWENRDALNKQYPEAATTANRDGLGLYPR